MTTKRKTALSLSPALSLSLTGSVALHALVALTLLLSRTQEPPVPETITPALSIEVLKSAEVPVLKGTQKGAARSKRNRGNGLRLADLTPNFSSAVYNHLQQTDTEDLSERALISQTWQDPFAYGQTMADTAKYSMRSGFYGELHRRIDTNLLFDTTLAQYGHFGNVYLMFAVQNDGSLVPNSLRAFAADGILKVRSAWAIRKGLKTALEKPQQLPKPKELWITARFFWAEEDRCGELSGANGPYLTFCRSTSDRKVEQGKLGALGYVASKGINALDPTVAYDAYKTYKRKEFRDTAQFDPFTRERNDPDYQL